MVQYHLQQLDCIVVGLVHKMAENVGKGKLGNDLTAVDTFEMVGKRDRDKAFFVDTFSEKLRMWCRFSYIRSSF